MTRRFGFNGATTGATDLLTDLRVAYEAGYQALEIRDGKLAAYLERGGSLYSLRQKLSEVGVEALSVNALEQSTLVTDEVRSAVLRRCRALCEWAAGLECPYLVVVPSLFEHGRGGATGRRPSVPSIPDESSVITQTVAALIGMVDIARPLGVKIAFEFLGFPNCSVNTLRRARKIVETVNDPDVGLVLDAFHFYVGGSTWEMLEGLDPARLFIVHLDDAEYGPRAQLTDAQRLLPGDGVIPLHDLIRRLQKLGYEGFYSIELFRPEYWTQDPLQLATLARQKMAALFPGG